MSVTNKILFPPNSAWWPSELFFLVNFFVRFRCVNLLKISKENSKSSFVNIFCTLSISVLSKKDDRRYKHSLFSSVKFQTFPVAV